MQSIDGVIEYITYRKIIDRMFELKCVPHLCIIVNTGL